MWNVEVGVGVMVGVMMSVGLRGNGEERAGGNGVGEVRGEDKSDRGSIGRGGVKSEGNGGGGRMRKG